MPDVDVVLVVAKLIDGLRQAGAPPTDQDWNRLTAQISNGFRAQKDEVAILGLSPDAKMLRFIVPTKFTVIGAIPVTAAQSLAAKTVRDKRSEIVNNFPTYRHPTVFEAIDLSEQEKAAPIQKIMSSPMMADGKTVGVIQISRKARPGEKVGPDFTPEDVAQLNALGSILGQFIAELPAVSAIRPQPSGPPPAKD